MERQPSDESGSPQSQAPGEEGDGASPQEGVRTEPEVLAEETRQHVQSMANSGRELLAARFESLSRALHSGGEQLHREERRQMSRYSGLLADQMEQAARYLQDHDFDAILGEVEHSVRRRPAWFVGGALGLGLLLGRFFRSSEVRLHERSRQQVDEQEASASEGGSSVESGEREQVRQSGAATSEQEQPSPGSGESTAS